MSNYQATNPPQKTFVHWSGRHIALLLAAEVVLAASAVLLVDYLVVVLLLLLALPIIVAGVTIVPRQAAIVFLLATLPLTGILKAVSGSRYAPLTFDLGILLLTGIALLSMAGKKRLRVGLLDLIMVAFIGLAFIQIFNPNVPSMLAGIEGFRKFAYMAVTFFIGRHIIQFGYLVRFRKLLLLIAFPVALYGIKQFFFPSALDFRMVDLATASKVTYMMGGQLRPFSTLPGPFHLGLYLMITILLTVNLLLQKQNPLNRMLLTASLVIQFIAIFLTRTKGNWVSLVAAIMLLIFLWNGVRLKTGLLLALLCLIGLTVINYVPIFASHIGAEVLQDALFAVTNPNEAPTFVFRLDLWQNRILPAIGDNLLFGYGTSSAGEGLAHFYETGGYKYFSSHNQYFKIVLEMGIIGLLLFLVVLCVSLSSGWRMIHRRRFLAESQYQLLVWSFCVVIAFCVGGIVMPGLDAYPVNYYFWLFLGLFTNRNLKRMA